MKYHIADSEDCHLQRAQFHSSRTHIEAIRLHMLKTLNMGARFPRPGRPRVRRTFRWVAGHPKHMQAMKTAQALLSHVPTERPNKNPLGVEELTWRRLRQKQRRSPR